MISPREASGSHPDAAKGSHPDAAKGSHPDAAKGSHPDAAKGAVPVFKRLLPTTAKHSSYVRNMGLRGRTRFSEFSLFFVTTTCHDFLPLIESKEMKDLLMENLIHYNTKYEADTVVYVFMPEHIHLMIFFRNGNHLSEYMRDFKRFTSKKIVEYWTKKKPDVLPLLSAIPNHDAVKGQKHKVWMHRFDDVHLYSAKVSFTKLRYINKNPVKRGLCYREEDYVFYSAAFYNGQADNKIHLTHLRDLL